ncbi:LysR family transcriptional regulator [Halopseudomonas laoshanensis]|uniref:LysR family transcriptional regulator n=1 Tax=Halopseudomonas laoshanensis TaxID=2268758 RepID=UPI003735C220
MLNLTWINTLVTLFQQGSFKAAADRLGLAQPTVTQHIQKLEEQLGIALVQRGRSGCHPTAGAQRLMPFAVSMLSLNQRALAAVRGEQWRVGASSNIGIYLLQPHVRSFLAEHGDAALDLVIDNNPTIAQKLSQAEIDMAIMEWWQPLDGFESRPWRNEPVVVIVPPDHPFACLSEITPEHLAGMALIGGESGTGTGRLLAEFFAGADQLPSVSMQLGSTEAVKQAVRAGLGISLVLASTVTQEVEVGALCAIPLAGAGLNKELMLVWRTTAGAQAPHFIQHLLASPAPHSSATRSSVRPL